MGKKSRKYSYAIDKKRTGERQRDLTVGYVGILAGGKRAQVFLRAQKKP